MADTGVEDRVCEEVFDISPRELYTLLLDPAEHAFMCTASGAYTIGETGCEGLALEGGAFSHWGGAVTGTYSTLQRPKKIVAEWRWAAGGAAWAAALPDGRDSVRVTWSFEPVEAASAAASAAEGRQRCRWTVHMEGVPVDWAAFAWEDRYFRPLAAHIARAADTIESIAEQARIWVHPHFLCHRAQDKRRRKCLVGG